MLPAIILIGVGVLLVFVSTPLVLQRVPKNNWYGVRLPCSYRSDACWYAANKAGGAVMLLWGLGLIVLGAVIWNTGALTNSWVIVLLVSSFVASMATIVAAICATAGIDPD